MIKRLLPWIFISAVVGVLVGMGSWQMERLKWKNELMAKYEAGLEQPPIMLSKIPSEELTQNTYRRTVFSGTYMHDKEIHLGGRRWHGKTGYQILTPMLVKDGRIFLVNRGWIPFELKDLAEREDALPATGAHTAVIRTAKQAQLFTPENHPEKNFWFTVDFDHIERVTGVKAEPVMLEVIEVEPNLDNFPIPADGVRVFRNDHLGYALTWYLLALAALVMFVIRIRR